MKTKVCNWTRTLPAIWVGLCLLSSSALSELPEDRLYNAISNLRFGIDRTPNAGSVRTEKSLSDVRSVFEGSDGKELVVHVWGPRIHPFKPPPKYSVSRPCLPGDYFETEIGVADFSKTHILRKPGKDQTFAFAFEWDRNTFRLKNTPPPENIPQKSELVGTVFENHATGNCQYRPIALSPKEDPKNYFFKHLQIARKSHATDLVFPKALFDFISGQKLDRSSEYVLSISNFSDVSIDFGGSTFIIPPKKGALLLKQNRRLALRNLNLEWAKLDKNEEATFSGTPIHGIYAPKEDNTDLWFDTLSFKRVPGWAFKLESVRGVVIASSKISNLQGDLIPASKEGAVYAINTQDLIIRDNTFKNLGNDAILIHGQMGALSEVLPPLGLEKQELTSPTKNSNPKPSISCVAMGTHWGSYSPGETLGIFDEHLVYQGDNSIVSVEPFNSTDPILKDSCKNFSDCRRVCFTEHPNFSLKKGGFVSSYSTNPSFFIIQGNRIEQVRGRGLVLQASHGIVSENTITHTKGSGMVFTADLANQLQGPGAFNIRAKDNKLDFVSEDIQPFPTGHPLYGAMALGVTRRDSSGRLYLSAAPLIQHIRTEGAKSLIDNVGSVALQIAAGKLIGVKSLTIGTSGTLRNLTSIAESGQTAEGSILISQCNKIDLSGLSAPALIDAESARQRTIVIDAQNVSEVRIPLRTKGIPGVTAHTLWSVTFRSWFKEDFSKAVHPLLFKVENPVLSQQSLELPFQFYPVIDPKVGDKESTPLGEPFKITAKPNEWSSSFTLDPLSPYRIQLRPTPKQPLSELYLSLKKVYFAPLGTSTAETNSLNP